MSKGRQEAAGRKLSRPGSEGRKRAAGPANRKWATAGLSLTEPGKTVQRETQEMGPGDENNSPSRPD
jgi:hypothetical protein